MFSGVGDFNLHPVAQEATCSTPPAQRSRSPPRGSGHKAATARFRRVSGNPRKSFLFTHKASNAA
jgi:hypothetical protein